MFVVTFLCRLMAAFAVTSVGLGKPLLHTLNIPARNLSPDMGYHHDFPHSIQANAGISFLPYPSRFINYPTVRLM
jgi:hypothetical protein